MAVSCHSNIDFFRNQGENISNRFPWTIKDWTIPQITWFPSEYSAERKYGLVMFLLHCTRSKKVLHKRFWDLHDRFRDFVIACIQDFSPCRNWKYNWMFNLTNFQNRSFYSPFISTFLLSHRWKLQKSVSTRHLFETFTYTNSKSQLFLFVNALRCVLYATISAKFDIFRESLAHNRKWKRVILPQI